MFFLVGVGLFSARRAGLDVHDMVPACKLPPVEIHQEEQKVSTGVDRDEDGKQIGQSLWWRYDQSGHTAYNHTQDRCTKLKINQKNRVNNSFLDDR